MTCTVVDVLLASLEERPGNLLGGVAEFLRRQSERTGDGRLRYAARYLNGESSAGAPEIDDGAALAAIDDLVRAGYEQRDAIREVRLSTGADETTVQRWRKKRRARKSFAPAF